MCEICVMLSEEMFAAIKCLLSLEDVKGSITNTHCVPMEECVVCVCFYACSRISIFVRIIEEFWCCSAAASPCAKISNIPISKTVCFKNLVHMGKTIERHLGYCPEKD